MRVKTTLDVISYRQCIGIGQKVTIYNIFEKNIYVIFYDTK